jgi:hypothetical protein
MEDCIIVGGNYYNTNEGGVSIQANRARVKPAAAMVINVPNEQNDGMTDRYPTRFGGVGW